MTQVNTCTWGTCSGSWRQGVRANALHSLCRIIMEYHLLNMYLKTTICHIIIHFIVKYAGKIFQDVIISVFSIHICTQICYNGCGKPKSLVPISLPHKPCDLFWLAGDQFTAAEVFHQHANTDVPVEWKNYQSNNRNAYNQVTQITHLNFNWGMLDGST